MLNKIVFFLLFPAWKNEVKKYEGKWKIENLCTYTESTQFHSHSFIVIIFCLFIILYIMITTIRNGEKIEYVGNGRQCGITIMGKLCKKGKTGKFSIHRCPHQRRIMIFSICGGVKFSTRKLFIATLTKSFPPPLPRLGKLQLDYIVFSLSYQTTINSSNRQ